VIVGQEDLSDELYSFKKFQQYDTVQYFIISCQSLYMFRHIPCQSSGAQLTVLTASGVDKQCVSSRRRG
jgi:hypothetical protein